MGIMGKPADTLRIVHRWISQICDPVRAVRGLMAYRWFCSDWRQYAMLSHVGAPKIRHALPQLHDRKKYTPIDSHYFYMDAWALRRLARDKPAQHVDIGSSVTFVSLLSALIPTLFLDYRPPNVNLEGLHIMRGSILQLPFANECISSLSCLHVAEHIGLGRYGDPLDPLGAEKAAAELRRVLSPGGRLYFSVPVGRPRLCFNAHRVLSVSQTMDFFRELELEEFSAVDDLGRFCEFANPLHFSQSDYACGLFIFKRKPLPRAK
jgi:SAM-dependent methyltransferase